MKKINKIMIWITLSMVCALGACNQWLDTLSSEEILEEDVFATHTGYRLALIGAYEGAADPKLWGRELTWGFLSAIGHNYQSEYSGQLPNSYLYAINTADGYNHAYTKPVVAGIWEKGYEVIANLNNLLKNIEGADSTQFEYPWEKGMITAEARGLRAVVHFELLRLFAPAPITNPTGNAIPYVRDYPVIQPAYNTVDEVIEYVIEDLEYARKVLYEVDLHHLLAGQTVVPAFTNYFFNGTQNLKTDGTYGNGDGFFSFRAMRVNYFGAVAMLARVHSYKRDNVTAVQYVDTLLSTLNEKKWGYGWYQKPTSTLNNGIDGKRRPEPFLSFSNKDVYEDYADARTGSNFKVRSLDALFGNDKTSDYRYVYYLDNVAGAPRYKVWDDPGNVTLNAFKQTSGTMLPVVELPEMIYIRCEYLAEQGKIQDAVDLLNEFRQDGRGCVAEVGASDYDSFMKVLVNDATRDFLTRGQTWHYLKKLNWPEMYRGLSTYWPVSEGWYVLPLPDSEIIYY